MGKISVWKACNWMLRQETTLGLTQLTIVGIHEWLWRVPRESVHQSFRVLWPDVGPEGTMNGWLVGSGIPRRTSSQIALRG